MFRPLSVARIARLVAYRRSAPDPKRRSLARRTLSLNRTGAENLSVAPKPTSRSLFQIFSLLGKTVQVGKIIVKDKLGNFQNTFAFRSTIDLPTRSSSATNYSPQFYIGAAKFSLLFLQSIISDFFHVKYQNHFLSRANPMGG